MKYIDQSSELAELVAEACDTEVLSHERVLHDAVHPVLQIENILSVIDTVALKDSYYHLNYDEMIFSRLYLRYIWFIINY